MKKIISSVFLSAVILATVPNLVRAAVVINPGTGSPCQVAAVSARENALMNAVDTYSAAWKGALSGRLDALTAAWSISNKKSRNAAIKAAENNYSDTMKTVRQTLKSTRQSVNQQYQAALAACN